MRTIDGYVCVASFTDSPGIEYLFGRNPNRSRQPYWNFEINGLTPYRTRKEVEKGKRAIESRDTAQKVRVARISMNLAQRKEDLEQLTGRAFVAVQLNENNPNDALLFGRRVKGKVCFDTRSELRVNGFKPYKERKEAEYAASEIRRQAWTPAAVATFQLVYLKR